jgi:hypothetical protein
MNACPESACFAVYLFTTFHNFSQLVKIFNSLLSYTWLDPFLARCLLVIFMVVPGNLSLFLPTSCAN